MSNEKIIEKVKKLFALGTNAAASDGERDNSLRMAYAILAKHNLTEDDLETEESREKIEFPCYSNAYARSVVHSIARLFFCKYYYKTGNITTHTIVGKTSNAVTAQLLAQYVVKSIEKEALNLIRDGYSSTYANSFKKGVSLTISRRVTEMINIQSTDTFTKSNGTSIVLKSIYESEDRYNDDFIKSFGTRLIEKDARSTRVIGSAYNNGKEFGNGISLNVSICNQNTLRIGV